MDAFYSKIKGDKHLALVDSIRYKTGFSMEWGEEWDQVDKTIVYFWQDYVFFEREYSHPDKHKLKEPEVVMIPACNILEIVNPVPVKVSDLEEWLRKSAELPF